MANYTKSILSGSTDGKGILVAATATPGTTIHTGSSVAADLHEIWLWCVNSSTSIVKLTVEWGEAIAPNGNIEVSIPGESGLFLVSPGLLIKGNASAALVVKAFAGTTNVLVIHGFVNKIT